MEGSIRSEDKGYELMQRVLKLWERYRPLCIERLKLLEEACTATSSNALDNELRGKAESAAHKLAGALGSIGLPEGSKIAGEIEIFLQPGNNLAPEQLSRLFGLVANLRSQLTRGPTLHENNSEIH
jgi:HPt (histidine-containing phosphotransfer) domain-containing protein